MSYQQPSPIPKESPSSRSDHSGSYPHSSVARADSVGGEGGLHNAIRSQFRTAADEHDILASPARVLEKDWAAPPGDKMLIERTVAKVHSALTERQQRVDAAERDLTQLSTVCNRSVHRAEERVSMAQSMLERAEAELARRTAIQAALKQELGTKRRHLSQFVSAVEEDRDKLAQAREDVETATSVNKEAGTASEGMRSRAADERADLEVRIATLQRELAATRDRITTTSAHITSARSAANSQIDALRQQASGLRRSQQQELDKAAATRQALTELCEGEEAILRRFRSAEDEMDEEGAAKRRLAVQDVLAAAEEEMRAHRTQYERSVEDYRRQIENVRDELLGSERDGARLKEVHIARRQRVDALQARTAYLSSLKGRAAATSERAKVLAREVAEREEALGDANRELQAHANRIATLQDIVAPAGEVSDSIQVLNRRAEQKRQELADGQAQHQILASNKIKAVKTLHGHCKDTLRVIEHRRRQISESNEDAERGAEEISTQLRVIEVETGTMEDNIRSLKERNDGLASSLDVATREKEAVVAELMRQKEAARKAASGLLDELSRR